MAAPSEIDDAATLPFEAPMRSTLQAEHLLYYSKLEHHLAIGVHWLAYYKRQSSKLSAAMQTKTYISPEPNNLQGLLFFLKSKVAGMAILLAVNHALRAALDADLFMIYG